MSWNMMPAVTTTMPVPRAIVGFLAALGGVVPSSAELGAETSKLSVAYGGNLGASLATHVRNFGADTDALARTVVENLGLSGIAGIDALARSFFARTALPEGFDASHGWGEEFHARQAGARVLQAVEWLALTPHTDGALKAVQSSFVAALDAGVQHAQNPINTASMAFAHGRGAAVRDVLDAWVVLTGNAPDHATLNDHVNFVLTQGREAWAAAVGRFVQGAFTGADGATRLVDTVLDHMALRHVTGLERVARDFFGTDLSQAGSKVLAAAQWLRDNGLQSADPVMRAAYQRYMADVDEAIDHSSSAASAVVRRVVDLTQPLPSVQPDTTPVVWGQDSRGLTMLTIDTAADVASLTQAQRDTVRTLMIRDNMDGVGDVFDLGQFSRMLDRVFIDHQSQAITVNGVHKGFTMDESIHIIGDQVQGINIGMVSFNHLAPTHLRMSVGGHAHAPATITINGLDVTNAGMQEVALTVLDGHTLNWNDFSRLADVFGVGTRGAGRANVDLSGDLPHVVWLQGTGGNVVDARNTTGTHTNMVLAWNSDVVKTPLASVLHVEATDRMAMVQEPGFSFPLPRVFAADTTIFLGGSGGASSGLGNDVFVVQGLQSEMPWTAALGFTPVAHDKWGTRVVDAAMMRTEQAVVGSSGADQLRFMVRADPTFGHPNPFNPDTLATSLVTVAANGGVRSTQAGEVTRFQRIVADDTVLEAGTNVVVFGTEAGITSTQELQAALQEGGRFTLRMGQAQSGAQADGFLIAMYHSQQTDAGSGATWVNSRLALIDLAAQSVGALSTHGSTVADQFNIQVDTASYLPPSVGVPQFEWTAANIAFI